METRAGVPAGAATNHFRNREALLVAVAERVLELHFADMAAATDGMAGPAGGFDKAYVRGLVSTMVHGALNSDEPKTP